MPGAENEPALHPGQEILAEADPLQDYPHRHDPRYAHIDPLKEELKVKIFEVNNPDPIAEPRASVVVAEWPHLPHHMRSEVQSGGPQVQLSVGDHKFYLTSSLAKVLCEELRVSIGLCELAEEDFARIQKKLVRMVTERLESDIYSAPGEE